MGQKVGKYCATHKLENMMNVKNKTCAHEGCQTRPVYNLPGQKVALYCATHKSEDMMDVVSKTCAHDGCKTLPTYNLPGQKVAMYCATHKLQDMINVKNKTCAHEGCQTRPVYNLPGQKVALYCATHKSEDMMDVKNKTCAQEGCETRANQNFYGYCCPCFHNLPQFQDHPRVRNYKNKERSVAEFVELSFPTISWTFDKRVYDGCSKRRPDILADFGTHLIMVEVDENQHNQYETTCENRRLMELSQDVKHRPIVVLRFNPDDYKVNGKKMHSCWVINKNTGLCHIGKTKEKEWQRRLNELKTLIELKIKNVPKKTLSEHRLFYDVELNSRWTVSITEHDRSPND